MCGIIGYTGERAAAPLLLEGLEKLEYRGYDSAGVAVLAPGGAPATLVRCEGRLARLAEQLRREPPVGTCGIGHTRWATHGRPTETNAHPHRVGKVSLVHNGIVENHLDLRRALAAGGRRFASETDTELVAHLVDEALQSGAADLSAAVRIATDRARGTWALCVIHDDDPRTLVAARHGAPLLVGLGATRDDGTSPENFVASDVAAILAHTRTVIDLEDGDIAVVTPTAVRMLAGDGTAVERPHRSITWNAAAAEKQGFEHFMLKEIHEQPQAVSDTLMGRISLERADVDLDGVDFGPAVRQLTLVACGTSWHAALAGKYLIEELARIPVAVDLASEFRYRRPLVGAGDHVVAISQSGETADTLAALQEAKRLGATTVAICNVIGSSITRAADQVFYTHAGPEISVASTKAFTTQLVAMMLLAVHLAKRSGSLDEARIRELLTSLSAVPDAIHDQLGHVSSLRAMARRYVSARDFLYLGRGLGFPLALEGALKLKEISYVHAEGYAGGEMKHGPIALIDDTVPVVVIALRGVGYDKILSNLEEVRARGARIIAVATAGDDRIGDLADDVIIVRDLDPLVQPIAASVPLQLLAYHLAHLKGTDVDQPRNLAKSVTVE